MRLFFILLVFSLWHVDAMAKCEKEAKIYRDMGDWSNWPERLSMEEARESLNKQYEFFEWAKQQGLPVEPTTAALKGCMIAALKQKLGQKGTGQKSTQSTGSKTFVVFDQFLGSRCSHVPAKTKAWYACREPYFREYIRGCGQLEDPDGSYPVARLREIMVCGDKNYLRSQGTAAQQSTSKKTVSDSKKTSPPDNQCAKQTGRDKWGVKITNVCSESITYYWCYKQISPMSDQDKQYLCRPHKTGWGPGTSYHTQGFGIAPGATLNVGILDASFTVSAVACKHSKGMPFLTGVSGNTSKGVCANPS